ncbi:unnamed protein product [Rotaria sordida]|uniref:Uncharacterized protein n=1 Tax=Rotaria sordida TaxID=392033 RepID=A0A814NMK0_9BILA|nr:unnamed protein product [Rotaria sordida]CAF1003456.1 unnamed protein product [Rotaria sordida]CAF1095186.1 unnamed protein product [Rotaria sordida]CAF3889675.1 unnamed protein product [Rotaria sordida]
MNNRPVIERDYEHKFSASAFVNYYYSVNNTNPPSIYFEFFSSTVLKILQKYRYKFSQRNDHSKVLEFGGGPNLWPSFLLAQYFDEIWFCDYTPANLQAVRDWINHAPSAHNWTLYFTAICPKDVDEKQWENKLRLAVSKDRIFRCDVNDPDTLIQWKEQQQPPLFDIIFSSLTFEAACLSIDHFIQTIKRLWNMLRPGGMMLVCSTKNETNYMVGNEIFPCIQLNEENVTEAFLSNDLPKPEIIVEHNIASEIICKGSQLNGLMVYYVFKQ